MAIKKKKCIEIKELEKIIELVDENHKPAAKNILQRLNFMNDTLVELEKQIKSEGAVIKAVNGNGFETVSEHPAQKSYNTMIGRYNALLKTLNDMIPETANEDEFMKFINGHNGGG